MLAARRYAPYRPRVGTWRDGLRPGLVLVTLILIGVLPAIGGGCSMYRFGACTLYAPHVRTVHVQMFENDTFRRGLGPWLTEAVAKEIQVRTPLRLADSQTADSFLRATWIADRKSTLIETINDDVRDIGYSGRFEVTWTDRTGQPLTPARIVKISDDVSFVPEAGQSMTTAQQELIRSVAQQVVNQMETPW
jgi:hypothetical protein